MKAKSVLLTVPLAVSALTFLTLPANAVCWSWKPCADYQGYGYGAPTESQAVLPPLPADGSVPPGRRPLRAAPGATAAPGPAGAPEQLKPAKKPAATATAGASTGTGGKPKAAPAPAQAKRSAGPPAPAQVDKRHRLPRQRRSRPKRRLSPRQHLCLPRRRRRRPAAGSATGTGSGPGSRHATGSCAQTRTRSGRSAGYGTGHDADGARHGDHAGDPRIGDGCSRTSARNRLS